MTQGAEIAQKIRSTADKDVTVILAQANKKSEIMKGEGDEKIKSLPMRLEESTILCILQAMQA